MIDKTNLEMNTFLLHNLDFEIKGENAFIKHYGANYVELNTKTLTAIIRLNQAYFLPKKKRELKRLFNKEYDLINKDLKIFESKFNVKIKVLKEVEWCLNTRNIMA